MTSQRPIRIGLSGALGRMGKVLAGLIEAREDLDLVAIADRPEAQGQQMGELKVQSPAAILGACDVIIDFSTATAGAALAKAAADRGSPALVIGATGWTGEDDAIVAEAGRRVAIVKSGNYSLGVNLLMGLARQAAAALPARDYDIEVFEAHHRRKVDAPSGTALMLGQAAADGRGVALDKVSERGRDGMTGPRAAGAIGFSVMRAGGIVGEHSVVLAAEDEIITLAHSARDRSLFARGALEAARWVADKPPGLYDMMDVLGMKSG